MKIYRYKRWTIIFTFLLFITFLIFSFWNYLTLRDKLLFRLIGIPSAIWLILYCFYVRISIDSRGINWESGILILSRQLMWDDIEIIVDDSLFPRLQFTHKYNLIPKQNHFEKRKKWIVIPACFQNYKDLLKEVVLRVSPDTKIEASILNLTGLAQQDIGRFYKREIPR